MTKLLQMHAQYAFRSKLKQKIAMKFKEKAIRKTEICKKQAQKTNKFQLKQAQKQVTCKSSKKPQLYKKKQAQIRGKAARLATLAHGAGPVWLQFLSYDGEGVMHTPACFSIKTTS